MKKTIGYAAKSATSPLAPFHFERREPQKHDLLIDILYCGVCHSDLHVAKNEWKSTLYPVVPGHEIIGRVSKVGSAVTTHKIGDLVGVGCIIGSCQSCSSCKDHLEQYCEKGFTLVFNTTKPQSGIVNYGGFSKQIVVEDKYALHIPKQLAERDLASAAPLLCAGITTYSPLKNWQIAKGSKIGIVGIGGLGHLAIKLAHAMGAHVVAFTTSPEKVAEAKKLGAHEVVLSNQEDAMAKCANSLDFILNTVAFVHNLNSYLELLKRDGTMCLVGLPSEPHSSLRADVLIDKRRKLAGSLIGSIHETQEMLEFCAQHNIRANIELIPMEKINEAFERMMKGDVKYRFVIDIASMENI